MKTRFKLMSIAAMGLAIAHGANAASIQTKGGISKIQHAKGEVAKAAAPSAASTGTFATITVDGNDSDWASIPVLLTDTYPLTLKVANDANYVYFLEEYSSPVSSFVYLGLDTDMNAATGCAAYGIGMEFGITIGSPAGYPGFDYIGDAQDCAWGAADYEGALTVASSNGTVIEGSFPISVLKTITPNLTGFNISDTSVVAQYLLSSGAYVPVGGTTTGTSNSKVICKNKTTRQTVTITNPGSSWDCKAAGLTVNAGDSIVEAIVGTVN